ncbi:MAG: hypothetical protein M3024_12665 [Candidatus Dormibacteraeota bacterium]|nr:hypothetical protein [Candidatus Dormibacteraeota bacterium]
MALALAAALAVSMLVGYGIRGRTQPSPSVVSRPPAVVAPSPQPVAPTGMDGERRITHGFVP